ncbi:MAG: large-conductance mechanosensitive channel protein MscL [Candidatus Delongbacteria bacterium]|jgi:large conductance mechanosensitive channel|nr:large-conductance mechanosensitive channel protein MscL [Candidatus Delongbacteria bacterium]
MGMMKEFKEFAMKGNVVDMAVGIIIGGAFGKIVASVVNDVIMPPIGVLVGGVDFKNLAVTLKEAVPAGVDAAGNAIAAMPAVTLKYGNFIQVTFDFLIVAFAIFMMIKAMNSLKRKEVEAPAAPPAPPVPTKEEVLLTEIRDLLKK